jgi:hypothetical protein
MLNCRAIPPESWEQAREALVFYFQRRHGLSKAEDLAHDTLHAILLRDDFEFAEEGQFLRVCYGFARRILLASYREKAGHAEVALISAAAPSGAGKVARMDEAETQVYFSEVCRTAQAHLTPEDWALVEKLINGEPVDAAERFCNSNAYRVHLHRLRRKLARLTGWRDGDQKV